MAADPARVLVTGATGLLGREVIRQLGPAGEVGWLARDPHPAAGGRRIAVDLRDEPSLEAAVRDFAPTVVFHLGGAVGEQVEEDEACAVNVRASQVVQRAAAAAGCRRLVVASTVLVLGLSDLVDAPEDLPFDESETVPYVTSKIRMERGLIEGARAGLTPATVLRFPRIYGERDPRHLPQMIRRLREGSFVLIEGGEKLQSWVHVADAARACVLAGAREAAAPGEVYHVTGGDRVTNREIAEMVADAAGLPRPAKSMALAQALAVALWSAKKQGRPGAEARGTFGARFTGCHHHYSIARARAALAYEPRVALAQGLPRAVAAVVAELESASRNAGNNSSA